MDGTYLLTLPLPGGKRTSQLSLSRQGDTLTGFLTNPYQADVKCPLYNGTAQGMDFSGKAMVGRTEFVLIGTDLGQSLALTLTTHETIPLEPGRRLSGKKGTLPGEYLVGVYSPGGVKENHFVITESAGTFSGEMYCLMDEKTQEFMRRMMPPTPDQAGCPLPQVGDKCDVNPFLSVTGSPNAFTITTRTGSGSLFTFSGHLTGDTIHMTLYVTDAAPGLTAVAE